MIKLRVSIIIWVSAASSTASPWDYELACASETRFNLLFRVLLEDWADTIVTSLRVILDEKSF